MGDHTTRRTGAVLATSFAAVLLLSGCATGEGMFLTGSDGPSDEAAFEDEGEVLAEETQQTGPDDAILAASGNARLPYPTTFGQPNLGGTIAGLTAPVAGAQIGANVAGLPIGAGASVNLNPAAGQVGVTAGLTAPLPLGVSVQAAVPVVLTPGGGLSTPALSSVANATAGLTTPALARLPATTTALVSRGVVGAIAGPSVSAGANPNTLAGAAVTNLQGAVMQLGTPAGGQTANPAVVMVPSAQNLGGLVNQLKLPGG